MSKIIFKHPCRYCLSRPICNEICDKFRKYHVWFSDFAVWGYIIFAALLFISIFSLLYIFIPTPYNKIVGTLIIIGCYSVLIAEMIGTAGLDGMDFWEKVLTWTIGPILVIIGLTYHRLSIEDVTENFIYRYIKRLQ